MILTTTTWFSVGDSASSILLLAGNFYPELTQGWFDWPDFYPEKRIRHFAKFLKFYPDRLNDFFPNIYPDLDQLFSGVLVITGVDNVLQFLSSSSMDLQWSCEHGCGIRVILYAVAYL
jgi:hypothetical protein